MDDPPPISEDLLRDADEIAEFIFGDSAQRRNVYHLVNSKLTTFKLGSMICARHNVIQKWIETQEQKKNLPDTQ